MITPRGFEFSVCGEGAPVLFIHGAHIADSYLSLVAEPSLAEFRKITYRRRGYSGSLNHAGPFSIEETADDALALLSDLGISHAHVAGHSSGGLIALQMALSAPRTVHSLVLLEPALMMVPSAPAFFARIAPAMEKYSAGDTAGAVAHFLGEVAGPDWRSEIPRMTPGGIAQAERDAATFFEVELPAVGDWAFDLRRAKEIFQPALYVLGTESGAVFQDGKRLCEAWIPHMEFFVIKGANHLLQYQNPDCAAQVARGMAEFFARHPIRI